ncbi:small MutS related family protein [Cavenderia fasciculata]|uniref:Small MutS related family protein n=1 Tax=Cavenderia fasciculata TaxID=261658 RepID=F4Q1S4_CACFS|nr:small MutS related family protein [Cavenderia fasciculata]EGG18224.1 small MutS related family protein [Cavenderia fasciculata]|eukprot:XP_004357047.1 small MutS related family protein [Cavenderia fasciculata]
MGNCAGKMKSSSSKVPKEKRTTAPPAAAAAQPQTKTVSIDSTATTRTTTTTAPTTTTTTTTSTAPVQQPTAHHTQDTGASSSSGQVTKTVVVDRELHKYIIGTKGATVKDIKDKTGATAIDLPDSGDKVSVSGTPDACDRAIAMINDIKGQHKTQSQKDQDHKDLKDEHEKESQRTDALYKKYQAEVDKLADERTKLNAEADAAFESGDKGKGHELKERAKQLTVQMEQANKKASREIFADKNKNLDKFTVDLHGLKTKDALELMDERMEELKKDSSNKGKSFTVITGAGNHSDENGPKIKPLIHKTFNDRGIKFEEVNNGSIQCTFSR